MRDVIAALLGALVGSAFSLVAALLYIAAVRRVGQKVFGSWLIFLWLPVHCVFALILAVPAGFFPFFALRLVGTSFPLTNALYAIIAIFVVLGLIPPFTYFFLQWRHLQRAGYLPTPKGLTNR